MSDSLPRRRFVSLVSAITMGSVAGCSSLSSSNQVPSVTDSETNSPPPQTNTPKSTSTPEPTNTPKPTSTPEVEMDRAWPMAYSDMGHTNHVTDESGPKSGFKTQWVHEESSLVTPDNPAIVGNNAYYYARGGNVSALSVKDGSSLWYRSISGAGKGSPAIVGESVIVPTHTGLVSLDTSTGNTLWEYDIRPPGASKGDYSAAGDLTVAQGMVFIPALSPSDQSIAMENKHMHAVDIETGKRRWAYNAGTHTDMHVPMTDQVSDGKNLYFENASNLTAVDIHTGEEQWVNKELALSPPTLANDRIFIPMHIDGKGTGVSAVNTTDGSIFWHKEMPRDMNNLATDGKTVYAPAGGSVVALNVKNGKESWSFQVDGTKTLPPIVADGVVYVLAGGLSTTWRIHALDAGSGEQVASTKFDHHQPRAAAVVDGYLYVPTASGSIVVLS